MFDTPISRNLITLAAVLLSSIGVVLVRRFVSPEKLRENNEFTGFLYAFLGVVYGVYLAFMIVIVWERFDEAESNTTSEAAHLNALWRDVAPLPDGPAAQQRVVAFAQSVVRDDWPDIAAGRPESAITTARFNEMWIAFRDLRIDSADAKQTAWYSAAVSELNDVALHRRKRIISGEARLPTPTWLLLIFGGVGMVAFTYLIAAKDRIVQILSTAFLTALVTYSILMVAALQHPFVGDVSVSPEAFENVLKAMR